MLADHAHLEQIKIKIARMLRYVKILLFGRQSQWQAALVWPRAAGMGRAITVSSALHTAKGLRPLGPLDVSFCVLLHSSAIATLEDNFSGAVLACLLACSLARSLACLLSGLLARSFARLLAWHNSATNSSPGTSLSVMRVHNVGDHQARHQDRFHGWHIRCIPAASLLMCPPQPQQLGRVLV